MSRSRHLQPLPRHAPPPPPDAAQPRRDSVVQSRRESGGARAAPPSKWVPNASYVGSGETELERKYHLAQSLAGSASRDAALAAGEGAPRMAETEVRATRQHLDRVLGTHEEAQRRVYDSLRDLGEWQRALAATRLVETAEAENDLDAVARTLQDGYSLFGEVGKSSDRCIDLLQRTLDKTAKSLDHLKGDTERRHSVQHATETERGAQKAHEDSELRSELERLKEDARRSQEALGKAEEKATVAARQARLTRESAAASKDDFEHEVLKLERALAAQGGEDRVAHLQWRDPTAAAVFAGGPGGGDGDAEAEERARLRTDARDAAKLLEVSDRKASDLQKKLDETNKLVEALENEKLAHAQKLRDVSKAASLQHLSALPVSAFDSDKDAAQQQHLAAMRLLLSADDANVAHLVTHAAEGARLFDVENAIAPLLDKIDSLARRSTADAEQRERLLQKKLDAAVGKAALGVLKAAEEDGSTAAKTEFLKVAKDEVLKLRREADAAHQALQQKLDFAEADLVSARAAVAELQVILQRAADAEALLRARAASGGAASFGAPRGEPALEAEAAKALEAEAAAAAETTRRAEAAVADATERAERFGAAAATAATLAARTAVEAAKRDEAAAERVAELEAEGASRQRRIEAAEGELEQLRAKAAAEAAESSADKAAVKAAKEAAAAAAEDAFEKGRAAGALERVGATNGGATNGVAEAAMERVLLELRGSKAALQGFEAAVQDSKAAVQDSKAALEGSKAALRHLTALLPTPVAGALLAAVKAQRLFDAAEGGGDSTAALAEAVGLDAVELAIERRLADEPPAPTSGAHAAPIAPPGERQVFTRRDSGNQCLQRVDSALSTFYSVSSPTAELPGTATAGDDRSAALEEKIRLLRADLETSEAAKLELLSAQARHKRDLAELSAFVAQTERVLERLQESAAMEPLPADRATEDAAEVAALLKQAESFAAGKSNQALMARAKTLVAFAQIQADAQSNTKKRDRKTFKILDRLKTKKPPAPRKSDAAKLAATKLKADAAGTPDAGGGVAADSSAADSPPTAVVDGVAPPAAAASEAAPATTPVPTAAAATAVVAPAPVTAAPAAVPAAGAAVGIDAAAAAAPVAVPAAAAAGVDTTAAPSPDFDAAGAADRVAADRASAELQRVQAKCEAALKSAAQRGDARALGKAIASAQEAGVAVARVDDGARTLERIKADAAAALKRAEADAAVLKVAQAPLLNAAKLKRAMTTAADAGAERGARGYELGLHAQGLLDVADRGGTAVEAGDVGATLMAVEAVDAAIATAAAAGLSPNAGACVQAQRALAALLRVAEAAAERADAEAALVAAVETARHQRGLRGAMARAVDAGVAVTAPNYLAALGKEQMFDRVDALLARLADAAAVPPRHGGGRYAYSFATMRALDAAVSALEGELATIFIEGDTISAAREAVESAKVQRAAMVSRVTDELVADLDEGTSARDVEKLDAVLVEVAPWEDESAVLQDACGRARVARVAFESDRAAVRRAADAEAALLQGVRLELLASAAGDSLTAFDAALAGAVSAGLAADDATLQAALAARHHLVSSRQHAAVLALVEAAAGASVDAIDSALEAAKEAGLAADHVSVVVAKQALAKLGQIALLRQQNYQDKAALLQAIDAALETASNGDDAAALRAKAFVALSAATNLAAMDAAFTLAALSYVSVETDPQMEAFRERRRALVREAHDVARGALSAAAAGRELDGIDAALAAAAATGVAADDAACVSARVARAALSRQLSCEAILISAETLPALDDALLRADEAGVPHITAAFMQATQKRAELVTKNAESELAAAAGEASLALLQPGAAKRPLSEPLLRQCALRLQLALDDTAAAGVPAGSDGTVAALKAATDVVAAMTDLEVAFRAKRRAEALLIDAAAGDDLAFLDAALAAGAEADLQERTSPCVARALQRRDELVSAAAPAAEDAAAARLRGAGRDVADARYSVRDRLILEVNLQIDSGGVLAPGSAAKKFGACASVLADVQGELERVAETTARLERDVADAVAAEALAARAVDGVQRDEARVVQMLAAALDVGPAASAATKAAARTVAAAVAEAFEAQADLRAAVPAQGDAAEAAARAVAELLRTSPDASAEEQRDAAAVAAAMRTVVAGLVAHVLAKRSHVDGMRAAASAAAAARAALQARLADEQETELDFLRDADFRLHDELERLEQHRGADFQAPQRGSGDDERPGRAPDARAGSKDGPLMSPRAATDAIFPQTQTPLLSRPGAARSASLRALEAERPPVAARRQSLVGAGKHGLLLAAHAPPPPSNHGRVTLRRASVLAAEAAEATSDGAVPTELPAGGFRGASRRDSPPGASSPARPHLSAAAALADLLSDLETDAIVAAELNARGRPAADMASDSDDDDDAPAMPALGDDSDFEAAVVAIMEAVDGEKPMLGALCAALAALALHDETLAEVRDELQDWPGPEAVATLEAISDREATLGECREDILSKTELWPIDALVACRHEMATRAAKAKAMAGWAGMKNEAFKLVGATVRVLEKEIKSRGGWLAAMTLSDGSFNTQVVPQHWAVRDAMKIWETLSHHHLSQLHLEEAAHRKTKALLKKLRDDHEAEKKRAPAPPAPAPADSPAAEAVVVEKVVVEKVLVEKVLVETVVVREAVMTERQASEWAAERLAAAALHVEVAYALRAVAAKQARGGGAASNGAVLDDFSGDAAALLAAAALGAAYVSRPGQMDAQAFTIQRKRSFARKPRASAAKRALAAQRSASECDSVASESVGPAGLDADEATVAANDFDDADGAADDGAVGVARLLLQDVQRACADAPAAPRVHGDLVRGLAADKEALRGLAAAVFAAGGERECSVEVLQLEIDLLARSQVGARRRVASLSAAYESEATAAVIAGLRSELQGALDRNEAAERRRTALSAASGAGGGQLEELEALMRRHAGVADVHGALLPKYVAAEQEHAAIKALAKLRAHKSCAAEADRAQTLERQMDELELRLLVAFDEVQDAEALMVALYERVERATQYVFSGTTYRSMLLWAAARDERAHHGDGQPSPRLSAHVTAGVRMAPAPARTLLQPLADALPPPGRGGPLAKPATPRDRGRPRAAAVPRPASDEALLLQRYHALSGLGPGRQPKLFPVRAMPSHRALGKDLVRRADA
ncbi:hypothetical protein M885DRAFT_573844 [Pelagophyceae sp. CCMP2097]|nr:hypothetical protein M885DRAFT_573844 [Pelagophyceae sp. CCMP2097]